MEKVITCHTGQLESLDESTHPWKPVVQELLAGESKPLESVFPINGRIHFVQRCGDEVTVIPFDPDSQLLFASMRAAHTALLNRYRKHVEGHIHNLRSPLSGIRSRTELTLQYVESTNLADPQMVDRLIHQIKRSTGRVLDASDQLNEQLRVFDQIFRWLDHSHEETPLRLRSVLKDIHAFYLTNLTFKRSIQWEEKLPDHIPPVVIQPYLFVEPIMHIIDNAIDILGESGDGTIAVSASADDTNTLTLRIQNSGPAFPADTSFEYLVTAGRGTRFNAPGCGLSFAAWLLTQAGGALSLSDNMPGNVTFTLDYPLNLK